MQSNSEEAANSTTERTDPPQTIGPFSAAAIVAASMIGAGVYTTSGFSLASLGSPAAVVFAWIVAGVIAICGAICYGALADRFTESGGEYLFLARAVHPSAGMVAGWVSLLAGFAGAMAFAATTFETYARSMEIPAVKQIPDSGIAFVVIIAAALLHSMGLHHGTRTQNTLVLIKLILVSVFLALAYSSIASWQGGVADDAPQDTVDVGAWSFILAFANALTWISLSYSGFQAAVYMTGEIRQPKQNVPKAMLWATVFVTLFYLLLNVVFVYAAPASQIAGQGDVATVAAQAIADQLAQSGRMTASWISPVLGSAILLGLLTSISAITQTGPRVYQKMAQDGFLPLWLFGHGPLRAIWVQALVAIIVVAVASLRQQLDYLGFTLSVCAALCGALVFTVAGQNLQAKGRFFYPLVPVIYVGGTLVIALLTAVRAPLQAVVGAATLGIGVVIYFCLQMRPSLTGTSGIDDK